jgi:pyridoxamine 5'-phosphate oxidase
MLPDPGRQFAEWYAVAATRETADPNAMTLATATAGGAPSARMVLLRDFDGETFCFYTGYEGRKAAELAENPRAALVFHWPELGRQVRIEGSVAKVSAEQSDRYFASRPPESRLGAWASHQSSVRPSREELERSLADARSRFADGEIPRPERWGGYRLTPRTYEFWQHGEARLHDRFRYRRDAGGWIIERLAP